MNFLRKDLNGNPFIGVSTLVTEEKAIMPLGSKKKDVKDYEKCFEIEALKSSIAGSNAIGSLSTGLGNKILVPLQVEEKEAKRMEENGIKLEKIECLHNAVGNLIALNSKGALVSPLIGAEEEKKIKKFFKVKVLKQSIAGTDLVGSALRVTEKGFIAHPSISEKDYNTMKKLFAVKGQATTANYGDELVAHSVVANSRGIAFGSRTSGPEMLRIDDALS